MWRFPVINSFRFASFTRWTLLRSSPARGNHNEASAIDSRFEFQESTNERHWFISNNLLDMSPQPIWDANNPIKELTSFDDFGIISLGRTVSTETVSSVGEKSFLDHLLKSGSSSGFTGFNSIPTTIDSVEMGGTVDSTGLEQLELLQAEGFDVSTILHEMSLDTPTETNSSSSAVNISTRSASGRLEQLEDEELESSSPYLLSAVLNNMTSSQLLSSFTAIPTERIPTRRIIPEEIRQRRVSEVRHVSVQSALPTPLSNLSELDYASKYDVSYSHASQPGPSDDVLTATTSSIIYRFDPPGNRIEVVDLHELREAIINEDIARLRTLITHKMWPEIRELHSRDISMLFHIIVNKTVDVDESMMFIRDFASSSRRAFVNDRYIIRLATRTIHEQGVEAAQRMLTSFRNMFLSQSPKYRRAGGVDAELQKFYLAAMEKGSLSNAQNLHEMSMEKEYDESSRSFLRAVCIHYVDQGHSFNSLFNNWTSISTRYGSNEAVDIVWDYALSTTSADTNDYAIRIGQIFKHSREHPATSLAEFICSLVRLNKMSEAKLIFSKVSVSGRYFREPIARLMTIGVEDERSLLMVERLGELVSVCMYGERRRGGSKTKLNPTSQEEVVKLPSALQRALDTYYGIGAQKKISDNSNRKKEKKKLHRVNEEQLHDLAGQICDAWMSLAIRTKDVSSSERLLLWIQQNRVNVPEDFTKKLNLLKLNQSTADDRI